MMILIKELMEGVLTDMVSDEEMYGRYYNWKEEQEKLNNSIIAEERDDAKKEGFEQGIQKNQREVVINMYKDNLQIETISKYTNLSLEEIKNIINNSKDTLN